MAGKVDVGKYLKVIDDCLKELYSDKIDLSKYKYREETPKAYATLIEGFKRNDLQFISKGINDLYNYTNPDIEENGVMKNYKKDKAALKLFYELSAAVKGMADEISRAVASAQAHAEAA